MVTILSLAAKLKALYNIIFDYCNYNYLIYDCASHAHAAMDVINTRVSQMHAYIIVII